MKIVLLSILSLFYISTHTNVDQKERYQTRTGTISFEASVPSFEAIEAENKSSTVVLDMSTGNVAALALVKGFRFPIALMQEHFNENYIESDDFPKAVLKGTLKDFNAITFLENGKDDYTLEGSLELHGVKKQVSIPVQLSKDGKSILLTSSFNLKPADFNIEIPGVVSKKIAKEVQVTVHATLDKK
ncbi:MAG: YceI family protein [Nonlabens sp.]|uniref:YceI family protein n=1 Tax=Nonlabens sp. TaxID=1888209 RepID=UPI003EF0AEEE